MGKCVCGRELGVCPICGIQLYYNGSNQLQHVNRGTHPIIGYRKRFFGLVKDPITCPNPNFEYHTLEQLNK